MGEDDAKRQKTEGAEVKTEDAVMKEEPPKEPEAPKEQEQDAVVSKAKPLKPQVSFEPSDCTLNVVPTLAGKVLMPLTDGGLQYLIAGARANVGVKKGRYVYEVKIVEILNPSEGQNRGARGPMPRNLVRVGFSTQDSSLFLGDAEDSVCFDSEGMFTSEKKRTGVSQRFTKDQSIAVVLNLDAASPNANTVSLFKDGVRVSQPQKLPAGRGLMG
ncbi:unnamed protein product, partial [Polarella glacialis]